MHNQNYQFYYFIVVKLLFCSEKVLFPVDFRFEAHNKLVNCKKIGQISSCLDKMKYIAQKLRIITENELIDRFISGIRINS